MNSRTSGGRPDATWTLIDDDPRLTRPPSPGSPGNVPPGEDLHLDIGWERFEQLLVSIANSILGLNHMRFRRYGVRGQAQHGIDLAGRRHDGACAVVQCKDYEHFTRTGLRDAVERFTTGRRPLGARHLIVAVSTVTRTTELEEELAVIQDEHQDLRIELRSLG